MVRTGLGLLVGGEVVLWSEGCLLASVPGFIVGVVRALLGVESVERSCGA
jgi:hypothetical protein